jgi:hypothetical protein
MSFSVRNIDAFSHRHYSRIVDTSNPAIVKLISRKESLSMQHRQAKQISRRRLALAMLCLLAHGLLVNAIHFHIPGGQQPQPARSRLKAVQKSDSNNPLSGSHTECVSCRLQRNFVSDVVPTAVHFDLVTQSLTWGLFIPEPALQDSFSLFSSRAPPAV